MHWTLTRRNVVVVMLLASLACGNGEEPVSVPSEAIVDLSPCDVPRGDGVALCGTYEVWEDRSSQTGRRIPLHIVVLPARDPAPETTPVFVLSGGPGAAATRAAASMSRSWLRERHDIVLVDQRGTGESNPLECKPSVTGAQDYLNGAFSDISFYEACRDRLATVADLSLYTTPIAMDDLDEVRGALGYESINLRGGSYGSRAALVYMRRHPETVRTATLTGIADISFTNPLFHAREAQTALDATFAECATDPACGAAFPELAEKFAAVLARLEAAPATVELATGDRVDLSRGAFVEGLRTFMYSMPRARRVPLLVQRAWEGDYGPVAEAGLASNRGIIDQLAMGMLLSVACPEDVSRIRPDEIEPTTAGTFLGPERVRSQLAACAVWPSNGLPDGYDEPVRSEVPTLLWSGTLDPVTGPRWGEAAAKHLPDVLHLVVPGAHGVGGDCVRQISEDFLESGSLDGLETSCTALMTLPPFVLSD